MNKLPEQKFKITIKTTYENVNPDFLKWWLTRFNTQPDYQGFGMQMLNTGEYTYKIVSPEGVDGTTVYKLERLSK